MITQEARELMTSDDLKIIKERFTLRSSDKWANYFTCNDSNVILCQMLEAYTPINEFKAMLERKITLIEEFGCDKFIFDKRSINGFHQPSMEWYYLEWKVKMYEQYGLSVHRKLFTEETWFRKAVQAGRASIRKKDPGSIVHTLDIKIVESFRQGLDSDEGEIYG